MKIKYQLLVVIAAFFFSSCVNLPERQTSSVALAYETQEDEFVSEDSVMESQEVVVFPIQEGDKEISYLLYHNFNEIERLDVMPEAMRGNIYRAKVIRHSVEGTGSIETDMILGELRENDMRFSSEVYHDYVHVFRARGGAYNLKHIIVFGETFVMSFREFGGLKGSWRIMPRMDDVNTVYIAPEVVYDEETLRLHRSLETRIRRLQRQIILCDTCSEEEVESMNLQLESFREELISIM